MSARAGLSMLAVLVASSTIVAAVPAQGATGDVVADVDRRAELVDDGAGVVLPITASCPPGYQVQEAVNYVVQGEQTSSMRGYSIPCDGQDHTVSIRVDSFDQPFRRGKAFATSYLLVINDAGETRSGGERQRVQLK